MSPIALLLLLLISAAGTTVEAYPTNEELSKTVNEGEVVQSGKVNAGTLEVKSSEKAGGVVDDRVKVEEGKPVGGAPLERKESNGASTRTDVGVRHDKEKRVNTKTKRDADNPNETSGDAVKSAVDKAPTEEGAVEDRNMKGKDNSNGNVLSKTSPSKGNAVVNSEVAAPSTKDDSVSVRDLSAEAAEATQSAEGAEAEQSPAEKMDKPAEAEAEQSPAEKMEKPAEAEQSPAEKMEKPAEAEKLEDSSEGGAAAGSTSEAESRSATLMLARQSVPISRVAFESDLESLSPELKALQQADGSSRRKNLPPVAEVIDDIRKRPMVSRIKYAKETLFPPIGGRPSSTDQLNQDMQLSKVSVNPYKETWELSSDPLALKLLKGRTPDLEHRIDPSTDQQLEAPVPKAKMDLINKLMVKLKRLAEQFVKAVYFIRNSDMVPDLSSKNGTIEFNVTPENRKVAAPNSTAALNRKLKSLSNELAFVKNMKKIMDGKVNGASPLAQKLQSLSSELAVDEAIEKSLGNPATNLKRNRNHAENRSA